MENGGAAPRFAGEHAIGRDHVVVHEGITRIGTSWGTLLTTEDHDRGTKMPLYAHNGVRCVWLVDPIARTLEVCVLGEGRRWKKPAIHPGDTRVCAVPFDAIELNLADLWAK